MSSPPQFTPNPQTTTPPPMTSPPKRPSQTSQKPVTRTQTQLSLSPNKLKPVITKQKSDRGWDNAEGFSAYMRHKNRKLRQQFSDQYSPSSALLSGVVIWVDGYTQPSRMQIKHLAGEHGAKFETYFGPTITHIIAETLATATRKRLSEMKRATFKIVRPQWLVDSIQNQSRMNEALYTVKGMTDPLQKSVANMFKAGRSKRKVNR